MTLCILIVCLFVLSQPGSLARRAALHVRQSSEVLRVSSMRDVQGLYIKSSGLFIHFLTLSVRIACPPVALVKSSPISCFLRHNSTSARKASKKKKNVQMLKAHQKSNRHKTKQQARNRTGETVARRVQPKYAGDQHMIQGVLSNKMKIKRAKSNAGLSDRCSWALRGSAPSRGRLGGNRT